LGSYLPSVSAGMLEKKSENLLDYFPISCIFFAVASVKL